MKARYRLRTLLILLAILPPLLAAGWWHYSAWRAEQQRQRLLREIPDGVSVGISLDDWRPPAGTKLRDGFTLDAF
jgi:hypothetical protein